MSGYPIVLNGPAVEALVVGGGAVAARKARALLESGARVRVVALAVGDAMRELALRAGERLTITERAYSAGDIGSAHLVVAAAAERVNARVARDAGAAHRLVNVASAPHLGSFVTPAVHRAGGLLVAVVAGGVPRIAARVRDAIALRFDSRYGDAVDQLGALRRRMLHASGRRAWRAASDVLVAEDFCDAVERGELAERVGSWR